MSDSIKKVIVSLENVHKNMHFLISIICIVSNKILTWENSNFSTGV